jgi:hypothetical protein
MYTHGNPSEALEVDRLQHDRHAACVIAQQYASASFVSLSFQSRKNKFGAYCKMLLIQFFLLFF